MYVEKLNELINEQGQKAIAFQLGCSQPTISRMSRGGKVRIEIIPKLAGLLDMPVEQLVNEVCNQMNNEDRPNESLESQ